MTTTPNANRKTASKKTTRRIARKLNSAFTRKASRAISRRKQLEMKAALERHSRKCIICHHPEREAIEEEFLHWRAPWKLAEDYNLADYRTLYRRWPSPPAARKSPFRARRLRRSSRRREIHWRHDPSRHARLLLHRPPRPLDRTQFAARIRKAGRSPTTLLAQAHPRKTPHITPRPNQPPLHNPALCSIRIRRRAATVPLALPHPRKHSRCRSDILAPTGSALLARLVRIPRRSPAFLA
jgi:hypothetical protein